MAKERIFETNYFCVEEDKETKEVIVSAFKNYHYQDEIHFKDSSLSDIIKFVNFVSEIYLEEDVERLLVSDIKWDIDEEDNKEDIEASLPQKILIELTPANEYLAEETNGYLENLSDWLSDTYGFCHNGFTVEVI